MTLYSNKSIDELKWIATPISTLILNGTLSKTSGTYTYEVDALADYMGTSLSTMILFGKFTESATETYTLTFTAGEHGTITATVSGETVTSPYEVEETATVVLTASPASGYAIDSWSGLPASAVTSGNTATFSMPADDVTASVSFKSAASYDYENTELHLVDTIVADITNTVGASALFTAEGHCAKSSIQIHVSGDGNYEGVGSYTFSYTGEATIGEGTVEDGSYWFLDNVVIEGSSRTSEGVISYVDGTVLFYPVAA